MPGDTFNTIIGSGTRFEGDLYLNGLMRIDGDFKGRITGKGRVIIGRNGRAQSMIEAESVVIGGALNGNIVVRGRVILLSTCLVIGNILAGDLELEMGVIFHGNLSVSGKGTVDSAKVQNMASQGVFSADFGYASDGNARE